MLFTFELPFPLPELLDLDVLVFFLLLDFDFEVLDWEVLDDFFLELFCKIQLQIKSNRITCLEVSISVMRHDQDKPTFIFMWFLTFFLLDLLLLFELEPLPLPELDPYESMHGSKMWKNRIIVKRLCMDLRCAICTSCLVLVLLTFELEPLPLPELDPLELCGYEYM